jgi:predicted Zn-dependent protease
MVSPPPLRHRRSAGPWIAGLTGLVLVGAVGAAVAGMGWPRVSSTVSGWVKTKVHSSVPAVPSQGVVAPAAPVPSAGLPIAASGVAASSAASAAPAPPPVEGIVEAQVDTPSCERLLEGFPAEAKPPSALAQIKRAAELLRVRKLDDAQRLYCRAITDHPGQAAPRLLLLELLLRRHDNQAVVVHGRQATQAFPQEPQFTWLLGDGLAKGGQWAEARAVWLGPSRGQPEEAQRVHALARQNLNSARAAAKTGYFAQAERAFRRVAILDPTDVEASTGLAQMLLRSDDPKAAAAWARQGLGRMPRYAGLHVMLGNALAAAGDPEGARAAWQEALKIDGGNREALAGMRGGRE